MSTHTYIIHISCLSHTRIRHASYKCPMSYTRHTYHTCIIQMPYTFPTEFTHQSYTHHTCLIHISYIYQMYSTRDDFNSEMRPLTYIWYLLRVPSISLVNIRQTSRPYLLESVKSRPPVRSHLIFIEKCTNWHIRARAARARVYLFKLIENSKVPCR